MIDLHNIDDPIALAEAVLALPCTNEGEAQALGAHAHRLAEMLADAADEAKAADTHRDLNRRIAEVLGLTGWRTDPETGEAFLPSWHDMPEKVEALKVERDAALVRERDALSIVARHSREICKLRRDLAAERSAPDFAGMEWMDDVKVWRSALLRLVGGRTDHLRAMFGEDLERAAVTWGDGDSARWDNLSAPEQAHWVADYIERAAMIAADKAVTVMPLSDAWVAGRVSNVLLTLTPALQARIEALGYTPGEMTAGVLPWLVDELENQRGYSAMLAAITRPGPLITGFAPDAVNVRDRLMGWFVTAYAMELKERTPEQAPNNLALAMGFPADHPLHGYRVEMSVARPEKPTPREQLDEARKVLDGIRTALGNGSDEALWPPGKTLSEAVKLLATMPFEVRALAKHYDRDGYFWSCLRCGGMWPRDIVTACATCHQSESAEGDEDDIEEEPVP